MKLLSTGGRDYPKSRFKRGKVVCPVCGKKERYHCSVTEDGGLVICSNRWSERQARDGRYIHILKLDTCKVAPATHASNTTSNEVRPVNADRLHAVYSTILSQLRLTPAHATSLLEERGLSDTTIAYNLYASVPDMGRGNRLARATSKLGFDLRGVPGFFYQDGSWRLNTRNKGFYVPYRDEKGRIVGLQIRRDGHAEPKYLWLSSRDLPEGTPASTSVHFAKPDLAERSGEVLITEGALKADRISEFTDSPAVAVAGVAATNPEALVSRLQQALPKLKTVVVAFDMDWKEKSEVRAALRRLFQGLKSAALKVKGRKWDIKHGKGFDDFLFNTVSITA